MLFSLSGFMMVSNLKSIHNFVHILALYPYSAPLQSC